MLDTNYVIVCYDRFFSACHGFAVECPPRDHSSESSCICNYFKDAQTGTWYDFYNSVPTLLQ